MLRDIQEFIRTAPVVDVHEHHIPEVYLDRDVGLLSLLRQSYAGWTQARPYPLPSEARAGDPMLEIPESATWDEIAKFVVGSGSNHFVRNLVRALAELYDIDGGEITRENWSAVDDEIRRRHRNPDWPPTVLEHAGITRVITDPYTDPLLDAREAFGPHYASVLRINGFAMGWHPDAIDHNGNGAFAFAERLGVELESFEDLEHLIDKAVSTLADRGQVALKNALAYDRDVEFDAPNEPLARRAWRSLNPTPEERKAFSDFVVDRFCAQAGERDVPVQMHLGTAIVRGSQPLRAAGLIERHPRTRFLLMHLAYPWSGDLLALAFVYRNVWLDLTWSFLLSPTRFRHALHEAIEVLPDESRLMIGGDNWHAEETYGSLRTARALICEVLQEKVSSGYFSSADAIRLARGILSENATAFFALE